LVDLSFFCKEYCRFLAQFHVDDFLIDGQLAEIFDDPFPESAADIGSAAGDVSQ
jgi:hypothetical protein